MSRHKGLFFIKPPILNGTNFVFWKVRMRAYLQELGANVWEIVESGYQYPASIPSDNVGNKI